MPTNIFVTSGGSKSLARGLLESLVANTILQTGEGEESSIVLLINNLIHTSIYIFLYKIITVFLDLVFPVSTFMYLTFIYYKIGF